MPSPRIVLPACLLLAGGLCALGLLRRPSSESSLRRMIATRTAPASARRSGEPLLHAAPRTATLRLDDAAMEKWARQNPVAALRWIAEAAPADDLDRLLAHFTIGLAEIDPARAAAIACDLLPSGAARQFALEGVAHAWLKRDASAAAGWALGLNDTERPGVLGLILYSWRDEAPDAVHTWAREIPATRDRDWVLSRLVAWQAERNPAEAAGLIAEISDPSLRARAASGVVRDWARDDFESAAAWTLRLSPDPLRSRLIADLAALTEETPDPWR